MFGFRFDYDGGAEDEHGRFISDPPHVYITGPDGADFMEVFVDVEPAVDLPDSDDSHWVVPPLVNEVIMALNLGACVEAEYHSAAERAAQRHRSDS